ncbi:putative cell wall protein [Olea europaea var. sylvestris]|uniref:putative cell wall protein n=1 Tax=Olea europaea var. sylvestris TaxID=158386 RepID=UPI000C1D07CA|nr:putative cell wall protein [Olea europaea var. sylvestris]
MGSNARCGVLSFLFMLSIVFSTAGYAFAGRDIPKDSKVEDKKQPQTFGHDGTVLIPGLGRYMVPRTGTIVNPFTYNPITGTNGGNGLSIPNFGGSTGGSNIPGGDDTFVPNPGVEVPNPVGGTTPTPSGP